MKRNLWAAQWYSSNAQGVDMHIIRENGIPPLFVTKKECNEWIKERFGYIATRSDLRKAPHGWRMPTPIKVVVQEL